jgi:type IV pilus assembly protein PilF
VLCTRYVTAYIGLLLTLLLAGGCPATFGKDNSKLSRTHYLLGADYVKKKMPNAAKRELFKSLELNKKNRDAHHLLGVIFFLEGVHKLNLLERTQCLKGLAASEQRVEANKEFRRCESHFKNSVKLELEIEKKVDSAGLNYLANVALHFKRFDEAIKLAKQALDNILYSSRDLPLATLGWAYYQKGDKTSAARELRQAIFYNPKSCVGRYRLAEVYYKQKSYDQAVQELKRVVDDKNCPIQDAHHLLGLAYMKKRNLELARIQFDLCVKLNPKSCLSEECRRFVKLM